MKKLLAFSVIFTLILFQFPSVDAAEDFSFNPHYLLSDADFTDVGGMTKHELDLFLTRGSLATLITPDVNGHVKSASDIIWEASQKFHLNPKFLLVLLQREQSLVEDDNPTQDQLNWAMGYAVCDDCSKSDPRIQKFKGFGKQVYHAAKRIRFSYIADLDSRGFTQSGIGPGIETIIDGTPVTPVNFATASLYTYTPHLHGNKNFVKIWEKWFEHAFLAGTLLQDKSTGGVWLIQNEKKRAITSRATLHSRFNPNLVVPVSPDALEAYPEGAPIAFPNYSLLRSPAGGVYLIVDDSRRGFTSQEAFRAIGFSPDEVVDVEWSDLDPYSEGEPITTSSVYPQGAMLQDKSTGGVFFVRNGLKHPIMSREIMQTASLPGAILPVNPEDLAAYTTADPLRFKDGTLVAANGSPDIFVIENGERRLIDNEETFYAYGWNWSQVIWTNERSVLLHELGQPLILDMEEVEIATE